MTASVGRRILKWTLLITPWLLAVAFATGWGLTLWTPDYLEKLIPEMAREMELPLTEFQVRNAGLFSADIGPVRLGSKKKGIKLNNVSASYTPATLRQGRVDTVIIHGVELEGSFDGTSLKLPVLDMFISEEEKNGGGKQAVPTLPFDELHVRDSTMHLNYQGTRISLPFSLIITPHEVIDFNGVLYFRDQAIAVTGSQGPMMDNVSLNLIAKGFRIGSMADLLPVHMGGSMDLDLSTSLDLSRLEEAQASVRFAISNPDIDDLGVTFSPDAVLSANATLSGQAIDLVLAPISIVAPVPATLELPKLRLTKDSLDAEFALAALGARLPGTFNAKQEDGTWNGATHVKNSRPITLKTEGRDIRMGGLALTMTGSVTADSADIVMEAATGSIRLGGTGLQSGPLKLKLPLAWPPPKRGPKGRLSVANIRSGKRILGSLSTRLRQESMGLGFSGLLKTQLLPDLTLPFSGHASMESRDAELKFGVNRYALPEGYDPGELVPPLEGITFTGNLDVEGGVNISQDGIDSRLGVFLSDGTAAFGESGTTMKGIRLYFESPDLINFRSSPAQMFSFDSLTAGTLKVENGLVTFQLEPGGVVLVERARLNWCNGHVESRAFRVIPGHDEYDVTLYCTGLKLTEILHQLNLAKANGDSALDGELPVTWRNGHISFKGGFLHSTPGEGGTIQVDGLDEMLASIPEGTPQRGQLELAKHAIKNFEYKWVRIRADTVGKELQVRLSVDGKPTGILPFVYRKEFGGFIMVEGDVQGSHFQGLRLDVNFNLPMDRILLYKDIIKRID